MEIVSNTALITINATMVVQVVSFLIFMVVINRVMFKPLRQTMFDRDNYVDAIRKEIADAEKRLKQATDDMERRQEAVKTEAFDINKALEENGNQEAERILADAQTHISELKNATAAKVAEQLQEARKQLKEESEALTVQIMEKVLDRRIGS